MPADKSLAAKDPAKVPVIVNEKVTINDPKKPEPAIKEEVKKAEPPAAAKKEETKAKEEAKAPLATKEEAKKPDGK